MEPNRILIFDQLTPSFSDGLPFSPSVAHETTAGLTHYLGQSSVLAIGLRSLGPTKSPAIHDDQQEEQINVLNKDGLRRSTRDKRLSTRLKDYVCNTVWHSTTCCPSLVPPISMAVQGKSL